MKIRAIIKLVRDDDKGYMLVQELEYNSEEEKIRFYTRLIMTGDSPIAGATPARKFSGVVKTDCYRFLEVIGDDNKCGKLLNIYEVAGD